MNELLLNLIDEKYYNDSSAGNSRNAGDQLAHIHNIRVEWTKAIDPLLYADEKEFPSNEPLQRKSLLEEFQKSTKAISDILYKGIKKGTIKGFHSNAVVFLCYMISHESHTRGQIIMTLKDSGHKLDSNALYGLWDWDSPVHK